LDSKSSYVQAVQKNKLGKILGIIFASGFLLVFLVHFSFSRFPAKTKKTDANISHG